MRIGYSFWGFLGDHKEDENGNTMSTPDGNAAYGCYLVKAMQRAGHDVYMMQNDRDWPVFQKRGKYDFSAFSQDTRFNAYLGMHRADGKFPVLDVLILEWRFPIPGRNTEADKGTSGYQNDLERQTNLLRYYKSTKLGERPKIVVWDLDYKFTKENYLAWMPNAVIETAAFPRIYDDRVNRIPNIRVEPPVDTSALLQLTPRPTNTNRKLVYVGSRYERDDVIEEWIKPVSDRFPGQVEFWGNWTREDNFREVQAKWPNIKYCDRITMKDFYKAYGDAVAVPLLAKKDYLKTGFITPRIWEALIFGSIPVGLAAHSGIEQYLPSGLIASSPEHLGDIVQSSSEASAERRDDIRRSIAHKIEFMDASNFVRVIERIKNGTKE